MSSISSPSLLGSFGEIGILAVKVEYQSFGVFIAVFIDIEMVKGCSIATLYMRSCIRSMVDGTTCGLKLSYDQLL